jgi:2-polyprenyl-3-methyl-5-hydroxy-6-metoxy-1,4-benzoquinol methylase
MFDWHRLSTDPCALESKSQLRNFLRAIRRDYYGSKDSIFLEASHARSVLDIGVCEHTLENIDSPQWFHKKLYGHASHVKGVDIDESLVRELKAREFNVDVVDACSQIDLGERFEVVLIGDVIEHVANPEALLSFAKRHLVPGGRIFVSTPNPFSILWFRQVATHGSFHGNLQHVAWFAPVNANELARRVGLIFSAYYVRLGSRRSATHFLRARYGEIISAENVFEFIAV